MKKLKSIPNENIVESHYIREAFNKIAVNLDYTTLGEGSKCVLVTSSVMGEGKTTVSVNLGLSLAANSKVLLIDADFRHPRCHMYLNIVNTNGLSDSLAHNGDYNKYIVNTEIGNLDVLTSGFAPPNPVALLGSQRMQDLIDEMKEKYDYIIIDAPPILPVPDTLSISKFVDGIILVIKNKFIKERTLKDCYETIKLVDGHIIGAVMNQCDSPELRYGNSYGYGYGYGYLGDVGASDESAHKPSRRANSPKHQNEDGEKRSRGTNKEARYSRNRN